MRKNTNNLVGNSSKPLSKYLIITSSTIVRSFKPIHNYGNYSTDNLSIQLSMAQPSSHRVTRHHAAGRPAPRRRPAPCRFALPRRRSAPRRLRSAPSAALPPPSRTTAALQRPLPPAGLHRPPLLVGLHRGLPAPPAAARRPARPLACSIPLQNIDFFSVISVNLHAIQDIQEFLEPDLEFSGNRFLE